MSRHVYDIATPYPRARIRVRTAFRTPLHVTERDLLMTTLDG
jgi:hypothetical protein